MRLLEKILIVVFIWIVFGALLIMRCEGLWNVSGNLVENIATLVFNVFFIPIKAIGSLISGTGLCP